MVVQLMTWPWKTPLINLADGAMSMMPGTQGSLTSWGLFKHRETLAGIELGSGGCSCCAYQVWQAKLSGFPSLGRLLLDLVECVLRADS